MPVIAVVNRKGGSGKSTFAAHVAAWCARQGHAVMLGDVDRQQSSRGWLRRRDPQLPAIAPWAMEQKVLRVPAGITHVVLDTPGGLHGFELARVVMFADAIVMPVCHSVFDRESAAACHAELMALPRVASGRCRVATVGMRIDGRTRAGEVLRAWSEGLDLPFLGVVRETQLYVRSLERGLTIFDLPPEKAEADLAQWAPILAWLRPLVSAPVAANEPTPDARANPPSALAPRAGSALSPRSAAVRAAPADPSRVAGARPASLMPAQESLVHGSRLLTGGKPPSPTAAPATRTTPESRPVPAFLQKRV
jgi:chromosome partitioning protein